MTPHKFIYRSQWYMCIFASCFILQNCAPDITTINCTKNPRACIGDSLAPAKIYVDPPFGAGFSCVRLGCDETRTLRIENKGETPAEVSLVRLSPITSMDFTLQLTREPDAKSSDAVTSAPQNLPAPRREQPLILAPKEVVRAAIRYRPSDAITDSGTFWIDWKKNVDSSGTTAIDRIELPIQTRVLGVAKARLESNVLNFGYVPVGDVGQATIDIENIVAGDAVLAITNATFSEDSAEQFSLGLNWRPYANPGEKISVPVEFTPNGEAVFFGTLRLEVNDPTQNPIIINVQGSSVSHPELGLLEPSNGAVDFGHLRLGNRARRRVTVRNVGGTPVQITPTLNFGQDVGFQVIAPPEGFETPLGPFAQSQFWIEAAPTAGDLQLGELKIAASDPTYDVRPIPIRVFVDAPEVMASPADLDFTPLVEGWTSDSLTINISNSGVGNLAVSRYELEANSSTQLAFSNEPPTPALLSPSDSPLQISLYVSGSAIAPVTGALLLYSNAISSPILRIPINASVVTCKDGCAVQNGTPLCGSGACEIGGCESGWHDTDGLFSSGCECREDRFGEDIGGNCTTGVRLDTLGDACTDLPSSVTRKGNLHDKEDIDLYFIRVKDDSRAGCDVFTDSSASSVELVDGPPGLILCARLRGYGSGCGGYSSIMDPAYCGETRYRYSGRWGEEDGKDITAWVMWHPDAIPVCQDYTLRFRGRK